MKIGKLRSLVTIEQPTEGQPDEHGYRVAGWTTLGQAWADILGLTGTQIEQGGMVEAETTHRIEIRFRTDLSTRMRVSFDGTIYNVTGIVDPDRRRERLFLFCSVRDTQ